MPQASSHTWTMDPAKTHREQLGDQRTRLRGIEVEIIRCPQTTRIEFDGKLRTQDGIRRTNRQMRRGCSDQLQHINEAGSPKGLVT